MTINDELLRLHAYATLLATLARCGDNQAFDPHTLQMVFEDIAKVTADAYAELEKG